MSENNILRDVRPPILLILVVSLIFIGVLFLFIGLSLPQDIKGGGLVMIGPIPFFFYTDELPASLLLLLPIFMVIIFIITVLMLTMSRRVDVYRED